MQYVAITGNDRIFRHVHHMSDTTIHIILNSKRNDERSNLKDEF